MACPIGHDPLAQDYTTIEPKHNKVMVQGRVYAVVSPDEAHYPPFSDYFTVSLYPSKGKVKYLKFRTKEDFLEFNELLKKYVYHTNKVFDGMQREKEKYAWYPLNEKSSDYEYR